MPNIPHTVREREREREREKEREKEKFASKIRCPYFLYNGQKKISLVVQASSSNTSEQTTVEAKFVKQNTICN